jgi:hypothetical protein
MHRGKAMGTDQHIMSHLSSERSLNCTIILDDSLYDPASDINFTLQGDYSQPCMHAIGYVTYVRITFSTFLMPPIPFHCRTYVAV